MTASRIKFFSCLLAWHLIFIFWVSEGSSLGFTFTAIRHLKKQVSRGKKGGIGAARHLIICACVQEPNGLSFCLYVLACFCLVLYFVLVKKKNLVCITNFLPIVYCSIHRWTSAKHNFLTLIYLTRRLQEGIASFTLYLKFCLSWIKKKKF